MAHRPRELRAGRLAEWFAVRAFCRTRHARAVARCRLRHRATTEDRVDGGRPGAIALRLWRRDIHRLLASIDLLRDGWHSASSLEALVFAAAVQLELADQ